MFFSNEEKEIMENLFLSINERKDEIYFLTFFNGSIVEAKVDTCYETDNGLDDNDINFEEYNACAMRIIKVIIDNDKIFSNGQLIEINYHNYPQEIKNSKGKKI